MTWKIFNRPHFDQWNCPKRSISTVSRALIGWWTRKLVTVLGARHPPIGWNRDLPNASCRSERAKSIKMHLFRFGLWCTLVVRLVVGLALVILVSDVVVSVVWCCCCCSLQLLGVLYLFFFYFCWYMCCCTFVLHFVWHVLHFFVLFLYCFWVIWQHRLMPSPQLHSHMQTSPHTQSYTTLFF